MSAWRDIPGMAGAFVDVGAKLGEGVILHPGVTIYAGVEIGDGCEIFPGAVIGRPPRATPSVARKPVDGGRVRIGRGCIIGAHAVIYQAVSILDGTLIGDGASIRELVRIGGDCIIGTGAEVQYEVLIENYARIMGHAIIAGRSCVREGAFVGMGVVTSNDSALADRLVNAGRGEGYRFDSARVRGVDIGHHAFVGSGANLLPGVRIGARAVVGAHALVTRDVLDGVRVMGIPAVPVERDGE